MPPPYIRRPPPPHKPMDLFEQVDLYITSRCPWKDPARGRVLHDGLWSYLVRLDVPPT
jgi:hypothetical protein